MTSEESTQELVELGRQAAELSHELRNLLVRVVSLAESLRAEEGDVVDAKLVKKLDLLRTGARACRALVDDVLTWASRGREAPQPTSVKALLDEVERLSDVAGGIRLVRSFPEGLPAVLVAPHRTARCLLNLVRNAAQSMVEAGREGEIRISSRTEGDDRVVLEIKDQGPGIPAPLQEELFEPFASGKEAGLGLGLTLARRIAREHGGDLTLLRTSNTGTVFRLTLPTTAGASTEIHPAAPCALPPAQVRRTLLLVEDDTATRESLRLILELEGLQVVEAETARDALKAVGEGGVDIVLSDLNLPDMSGAVFYDRLVKADPRLARRCIFATGDVASPRALEFLNALGVPYLIKPFDASDLRSALTVVGS